jgi:hypothetical protein
VRERRALRFLVEALFLGALAAALVVADLDPLWIAGVMLLGWIVVAFYEWAATRELPHYGRGLPPRYYVPQIALPPPRQLDQLRSGYPAAGPDDQATWIATPAMRAEALADWPVNPVAGPLPAPTAGEDTIVVDLPFVGEEEFHQDTWIQLDPVAEGKGPDEDAVAVVVVEEEVVEVEAVDVAPPVAEVEEAVDEPEVEVPAAAVVPEEPVAVEAVVEDAEEGVVDDLEPAPLAAAAALAEAEEPVEAESGNGSDPVVAAAVAAAVGAADRDAPSEPEEHEPGREQAVEAAVAAAVVAGDESVAEADAEDDTAESATQSAPAPTPDGTARHTFDPLAGESPTRRRWRRRDDPWVEVPARPPTPMALPGASRREP